MEAVRGSSSRDSVLLTTGCTKADYRFGDLIMGTIMSAGYWISVAVVDCHNHPFDDFMVFGQLESGRDDAFIEKSFASAERDRVNQKIIRGPPGQP